VRGLLDVTDPRDAPPEGGLSPAAVDRAREALGAWFDRNQRDLPWRRTSDPYAIWISEVMLQQTRVETVIPYHARFLGRIPTLRDLARADPETVRALWSGLGYYRRAAQLQAAAKKVVEEYGGVLPADPEALRSLPGFGPYTVGAVSSFAFDLPVPAVDGNVKRVLARLHGVEGATDRGPARRQIEVAAQSWVDAPRPGRTNESLMELGATLCTPKRPACARCPVATWCRARAMDATDRIPPPKARAAPKRQAWTAVCVWSEGRVYLEPRAAGIFAGLWCLPMTAGDEPAQAEDLVDAGTPLARPLAELGIVEHVLTHRRLVVRVWGGPATAPRGRRARTGAWVPLTELGERGVPTFTAKVLRTALPPELRAEVRWRGRRSRAGDQPGLPGV
jgi:A/G-specific adenine glycosylase